MTQIMLAGALAFVVSLVLNPLLIRYFRSREGMGQQVRLDGPETHLVKQDTPSMGGIAVLIALWVAYLVANLVGWLTVGSGPSASGLLVMALATALAGLGFADDYMKIREKNTKGLSPKQKTVLQILIGVGFAWAGLGFRDENGLTPATTNLSFVRDYVAMSLPVVLFFIFVIGVVWVWSNAVNLTDGLDGLAAGSTAMIMGTYVIICFWQFRYSCFSDGEGTSLAGCYAVRDPLDLAVVCAAAMGACVGFLWWNAAPAKIFMGDTGSMLLGGLVAGISIFTKTELLMVVAGSLFIVELASVLIQVAVFKGTGQRVFRMAPIHHHFEKGGWKETTVTIRFWILVAISAALALSLFYGDWLAETSVS